MIIFLPLLISLIGLVIYLGTEGKLPAVGLHMFWVGLLVFLFHYQGAPIKFP